MEVQDDECLVSFFVSLFVICDVLFSSKGIPAYSAVVILYSCIYFTHTWSFNFRILNDKATKAGPLPSKFLQSGRNDKNV
jgi:predicted permease